MKIGLSLSFCVRDIAAGIVAECDVSKIITGTRAGTEGRWYDLLDLYAEMYWKAFPEEARKIAIRLMRAGKIYEPRAHGEMPPNISQGHWVEAEGEAAERLHWREEA